MNPSRQTWTSKPMGALAIRRRPDQPGHYRPVRAQLGCRDRQGAGDAFTEEEKPELIFTNLSPEHERCFVKCSARSPEPVTR
jgi:hypothetical protein